MKKTALEKNKEYSEKYIQKIDNPSIPFYLKEILKSKKINSFMDLGCGDGILIHAIKKEFPQIKVVGIDISKRRIDGLKKKFTKDKFYCMNVCDTKLKNKFDFVHSSQVIEHVSSDKEMVKEISRLIKTDGILFCSSVIKKSWAIYQYRNNGKFVLDPTHEREYKNQKEFLDLFKEDFKLIKSWIVPVRRRVLGISIKIPGYYLIFGIWKKRK